MARALLEVGDRLTSVTPEGCGTLRIGKEKVWTIVVNQLPGPMGFYLVAVVTFEDDRADAIIPLHMAAQFEALNP